MNRRSRTILNVTMARDEGRERLERRKELLFIWSNALESIIQGAMFEEWRQVLLEVPNVAWMEEWKAWQENHILILSATYSLIIVASIFALMVA